MKTKLTLTATLFFFSTILFITSPLGRTGGAFAQNIAINGTGALAHASAALDVSDAPTLNKGVLIPRIALTAINAAAPVTSPATSLLVFNTASASTGTNAVSPGYYYWDGTKWVRFAYNSSGSSSTAWDLLGNTGTTAGTHFVGTTDNVDLIFKRNGVQAALLNTSLGNTSFGVSALNSLNTGIRNTAFGLGALQSSTTGSLNSAFGYAALALNTNGARNIAIGYASLANCLSGNNNISIGVQNMTSLTTGLGNVSLGGNALLSNTSGSYNTVIGHSAGATSTLSSYNTLIGSNTDLTADTYTNATAIGYNAKVGQSNALILGGTGANAVEVGIGITLPSYKLDVLGDINASGEVRNSGVILTSDARLKKGVVNLNNGLESVMKLRPVSYLKKETLQSTDYNHNEIGFIAQEVEKIFPQLISLGKDKDALLGLNYVALIPVLTKAMQEQQQQIEELKKQNAEILQLIKNK